MQSFLEFLCHKLMGPPAYGSSYWHCPICDSPKFSVRPPKAGFKVRFKCFRCDEWGDEADLLKLLHPEWDYSTRLMALDDLRAKYEAECEGNDISSQGPGSAKQMTRPAVCIECQMREADYDPREDEFSPTADAAIHDLLEHTATSESLVAAQRALEICAAHGIHPLGFAGRVGFVVWQRESAARHVAQCREPECDHIACIRVRLEAQGRTDDEIESHFERLRQVEALRQRRRRNRH